MSDVERVLAEAGERIRRDAYAAGWRDCLAALAKAISNITPDELANSASTEAIGAEALQRPHANASNPPNLPTVGTTPHYVYQAVKKRPGMTGFEVIAAVRTDGHSVAEPQIRTALSRLEKRGLIANRHKKWFPE